MKLALARSLLLERDILFLDEPMLGLDVKTINLSIDIIKKFECTIIFTSHDLSVVEKLCNRIAFIHEGKIIKVGTQDEIKDLAESNIRDEISVASNKSGLISELNNYGFVMDIVDQRENNILVQLKERANYKELFSILYNYGIIRIKEVETPLEDLFLKIY